MRTQEQIIADCEKRFAEIEAEAKRRAVDPARLWPCETCRHSSGSGNYTKCREPLIVAFDEDGYVWAWDCKDGTGKQKAALCGPEKALWQPKQPKRPKLTLCQCIKALFESAA